MEESEVKLEEITNNATQEDFKMKNKVYEMIRYGSPVLMQFPRQEKYVLAEKIRSTMYDVFELVITLENKHYKKTTLGDLDTKIDVLRHFVRLAADDQLYPDKKPCISLKKYEVWSKKIDEIGRMIGGYYKSLQKK
jgi:hypothetical protein